MFSLLPTGGPVAVRARLRAVPVPVPFWFPLLKRRSHTLLSRWIGDVPVCGREREREEGGWGRERKREREEVRV